MLMPTNNAYLWSIDAKTGLPDSNVKASELPGGKTIPSPWPVVLVATFTMSQLPDKLRALTSDQTHTARGGRSRSTHESACACGMPPIYDLPLILCEFCEFAASQLAFRP